MSERPGITARELARDTAFLEALERYAKHHGSPETVAWCALRAIERAAAREQAQPGASAAPAEPARAEGEEQPA